jgi:hypothetical protein
VTTAIRSVLAATVLVFAGTSAARADCIVGGGVNSKGRSPLKALERPAVAYSSSAAAAAANDQASIVGLWTVTFLIGDGPDLYDQAFEIFHADGTEITNDTAVPPAAGNLCLGVWEKTGARSIKLHHVGWNWDLGTNPASLAGVFVLDLTATVAKDGRTFSGRYVTDSYDNDGAVIPAFHAEGVITGKRITPNSLKW